MTESAQFRIRSETDDDLDLVHTSKNGDVAAFEQLVKRYDDKLFRIARSVTHNREDSQDAVQETFFKAYQHLAEFRGDSQFSTWLIRITLNQSLMKLRKQRATIEVSLDEDLGQMKTCFHGRSSIGLPMPKNFTACRNYETFYSRP